MVNSGRIYAVNEEPLCFYNLMWFVHLSDSTALGVTLPCPSCSSLISPLHPTPHHGTGGHLSCVPLNDMPALTRHSLPTPTTPTVNTLKAEISVLLFLFWIASATRPPTARSDWRLISIWCVNEWPWVQSIYSRVVPLPNFQGKKISEWKEMSTFY